MLKNSTLKICSDEDCSRPVHARGYCGPGYKRALRRGTLVTTPTGTPAERFFDKVEITPTCWIWIAGKSTGYGVFRLRHQSLHESDGTPWLP